MDRHAGEAEEPLSRSEVVRRAGHGAGIIAMRGVAIRGMGFAGSVVLARLLTPEDFGAVAIGSAVLAFMRTFSDGGMGVGLIRRAEPATPDDLRSLLFVQLAATTALAVAIAVVALWFGHVGRITALMVVASPLAAFRAPAVVQLERRLDYRPLATLEVLETAAGLFWAIGTVSLGWGVVGLATAGYARGIVGAVGALIVSPVRIVKPLAAWGRIRSLMRFGVLYQSTAVAGLVRDQGLNIGVAALGGVTVLGYWSLVNRLLQVPFLLFQSLWQVSFPAMSRMQAAGEEVGKLVARSLRVVTVATSLLLAGLVGAGPSLVPALFGSQWREAAPVLVLGCLGLAISGPVSVSAAGYLFAVGAAGDVLRSTVFSGVVWLSITLPLVGSMGVLAVGLGLVGATLAEAQTLRVALKRRCGVEPLRHLWLSLSTGAVASATGWFVNSALPESLASAAGTAALTVGIHLLLMGLFDRQGLFEATRTVTRALRAS